MDSKQVRNIMEAYVSVYQEKKEVEQLDEEGIGAKASKVLDKVTKAGQSALERVGVPINRVPRPTARPTTPVKEGVDLFEYLLEYLVAEGYADTNESALVIMANMSEEWKQDIVEQMTGGPTDSPSDEKKSFTGEGPKKPKGWKPTGPKLKPGQRPGYAR
jgi:hypothetical protein